MEKFPGNTSLSIAALTAVVGAVLASALSGPIAAERFGIGTLMGLVATMGLVAIVQIIGQVFGGGVKATPANFLRFMAILMKVPFLILLFKVHTQLGPGSAFPLIAGMILVYSWAIGWAMASN